MTQKERLLLAESLKNLKGKLEHTKEVAEAVCDELMKGSNEGTELTPLQENAGVIISCLSSLLVDINKSIDADKLEITEQW